MKIFLDTNILMDVFVRDNRMNYSASARVLDAAKNNSNLYAYISVQSVTDVAYYYTKRGVTDPSTFIAPLKSVLSYVRLRTVSEQDVYNAIAGSFSDFEDDLLLQCEIDSDCAYFITGDQKIIQNQPYKLIKAIHPTDFLALASRQTK